MVDAVDPHVKQQIVKLMAVFSFRAIQVFDRGVPVVRLVLANQVKPSTCDFVKRLSDLGNRLSTWVVREFTPWG